MVEGRGLYYTDAHITLDKLAVNGRTILNRLSLWVFSTFVLYPAML